MNVNPDDLSQLSPRPLLRDGSVVVKVRFALPSLSIIHCIQFEDVDGSMAKVKRAEYYFLEIAGAKKCYLYGSEEISCLLCETEAFSA